MTSKSRRPNNKKRKTLLLDVLYVKKDTAQYVCLRRPYVIWNKSLFMKF